MILGKTRTPFNSILRRSQRCKRHVGHMEETTVPLFHDYFMTLCVNLKTFVRICSKKHLIKDLIFIL